MRAVWLSGCAALLLLIGLTLFLAPLQPDVLALQMAFSPRAFGAVVHAWGHSGLARFQQHLPWDFALLMAYGCFGYLLARRSALFRSLPGRGRWARWLMPAAALGDALENGLQAWLTAAPRFDVPSLYALAAGAALAKWVLIIGFGSVTALALLKARP